MGPALRILRAGRGRVGRSAVLCGTGFVASTESRMAHPASGPRSRARLRRDPALPAHAAPAGPPRHRETRLRDAHGIRGNAEGTGINGAGSPYYLSLIHISE